MLIGTRPPRILSFLCSCDNAKRSIIFVLFTSLMYMEVRAKRGILTFVNLPFLLDLVIKLKTRSSCLDQRSKRCSSGRRACKYRPLFSPQP
jgi:hypothetical protein